MLTIILLFTVGRFVFVTIQSANWFLPSSFNFFLLVSLISLLLLLKRKMKEFLNKIFGISILNSLNALIGFLTTYCIIKFFSLEVLIVNTQSF